MTTSWQATMVSDPWKTISTPTEATLINARRVDETSKWNFYWGRDSDGKCLCILRHDPSSGFDGKLPRLKGLEIFTKPSSNNEKPALVWRLTDPPLREIFLQLCQDIIKATGPALNEAEALAGAIGRTWRWHYLLRGGPSDLLTAQQQLGLLGELFVLEKYLVPTLGSLEAVLAWNGPLGAVHDFTSGNTSIESKACGSTANGAVRISSEFQLQDADLTALYLHLCMFTIADIGENKPAFTISDVALRVRSELGGVALGALDRYDALLSAAGFRFQDDYSGFRWIGGEKRIFKVGTGFPRIISSELPPAISSVKYTLSLNQVREFAVERDVLITTLRDSKRAS